MKELATEVALEEVAIDEGDVEQPRDEETGERRRSSVRDMMVKKSTHSKRLHSNASSGMENSTFRFRDVNFVVGKGEKEKYILSDVSHKIKSGHVLAVMGPSGAGKTTMISALTLDAFYGNPYGNVTLNGVPMTDKIFKRHAFVVKQQDKHWPYLTARETMTYAAELYEVGTKNDIPDIVGEIITTMGLDGCADTRCARLSGGQRRRLSIAVALLKQPTLLLLDEPTSGLDAAAASHIMQEIRRVAKEERLIIVCTIHQPSTKVYNGFDEVMILSKGREAFTGNVIDATPYFEDIGYPLPPATNPAEHFLDLVNADFSNDKEIDNILDTWQEKKPEVVASMHGGTFLDEEENEGVVEPPGTNMMSEIQIMFRRHFTLVYRDPILYLGRAFIFLVSNIIFALVYLKARPYDQDQAANKMWLNIWFIGVPSNMGVVAVYALNDEFKSIMGEVKNGMVRPLSYMLAKTVLVLPIMLIFAIFALGIPAYAIQDFPQESFLIVIALWSTVMYVFESLAEALAVWFDDPIMGMLNFMQFWFASFLFAGFLIPLRDMYWPFKLFYYVMPYQYYVRSVVYAVFIDADWSECDPDTNDGSSAVCVQADDGGEVTGADVLDGLGVIYPLIESNKNYAQDFGVMLAIAMFYKILYVVGIMYKTSRVAVPVGTGTNVVSPQEKKEGKNVDAEERA